MNPVNDYIDAYCSLYLNRNVWFCQEVASVCRKIAPMTKKVLTLPASQIPISYITDLFEIQNEKNQNNDQKQQKQQKKKDKQNRQIPDISVVEALLSQFGDKRHDELVFLETQGKVTFNMFCLLNVLYYKLRHHERNDVVSITSYIFSMRVLSLDDLDYPEMSHIKFARNDIVWYLWQLLLLYANRVQNALVTTFVKSNFNIFSTSFQKKNRETRLQIIHHVYNTLCKKEHGLYNKELVVGQEHEHEQDNESSDNVHPLMRKHMQYKNPNKPEQADIKIKNKKTAKTTDSKTCKESTNEEPIQFEYLKMFTYYPIVASVASVASDESTPLESDCDKTNYIDNNTCPEKNIILS